MSFIIKKPIDNTNIFRFLPDNHTIGTEEYYRNKFGDKFPDEVYKYLEAKTREEYTDADIKYVIEQINEANKHYEKQLLMELEERLLENLEEDINIENISIE
jgi:predicted house-cleaning noncanonical NTP pyrophosphatase (MazG superfamily)